jgi:hypothetical protein
MCLCAQGLSLDGKGDGKIENEVGDGLQNNTCMPCYRSEIHSLGTGES